MIQWKFLTSFDLALVQEIKLRESEKKVIVLELLGQYWLTRFCFSCQEDRPKRRPCSCCLQTLFFIFNNYSIWPPIHFVMGIPSFYRLNSYESVPSEDTVWMRWSRQRRSQNPFTTYRVRLVCLLSPRSTWGGLLISERWYAHFVKWVCKQKACPSKWHVTLKVRSSWCTRWTQWWGLMTTVEVLFIFSLRKKILLDLFRSMEILGDQAKYCGMKSSRSPFSFSLSIDYFCLLLRGFGEGGKVGSCVCLATILGWCHQNDIYLRPPIHQRRVYRQGWMVFCLEASFLGGGSRLWLNILKFSILERTDFWTALVSPKQMAGLFFEHWSGGLGKKRRMRSVFPSISYQWH